MHNDLLRGRPGRQLGHRLRHARGSCATPWYHHIALLEKLDRPAERLWYAQQAVANGWSHNILLLQIQSRVHERQGKAITNFGDTLPPAESDLAVQVFKDPCLFDVLGTAQGALRCAVRELAQAFALAVRRAPVAEMLEQTIRRYQKRAIEAARVIEELIRFAKDLRESNARGELLGLSERSHPAPRPGQTHPAPTRLPA